MSLSPRLGHGEGLAASKPLQITHKVCCAYALLIPVKHIILFHGDVVHAMLLRSIVLPRIYIKEHNSDTVIVINNICPSVYLHI